MNDDDRRYLKEFFRELGKRELSPDHRLYVPIYEHPGMSVDDPVKLLARGVEWTPGGSVQLFSGFRGTGKSTELRRLKRDLEAGGYLVVLCDMADYLDMHDALDIGYFLLALMGAFGEGLAEPGLLGTDPAHRGYWSRFSDFLTRTRVEVDELSLEAGEGLSVGLKASLKQDPTIRARIKKVLAGHLAKLVDDVRGYVRDCVKALKKRHGDEREVVLIVDSVEQIRGATTEAREVQASVSDVFTGHPDKLALPNLHVVYTVPPYLKILYAGIGSLYEPGGLQLLPAIKVKERDGRQFQPGLDLLHEVATARGDWQRLVGGRDALDKLALLSGGHLRDLLRFLMEAARRAQQLPVTETTLQSAIDQVRNENLPITEADARWIGRIIDTHDPSLVDLDRLPDLARLLDTHLVLCYRNGKDWFDAHPLIADEVQRLVQRLQAEAKPREERGAD